MPIIYKARRAARLMQLRSKVIFPKAPRAFSRMPPLVISMFYITACCFAIAFFLRLSRTAAHEARSTAIKRLFIAAAVLKYFAHWRYDVLFCAARPQPMKRLLMPPCLCLLIRLLIFAKSYAAKVPHKRQPFAIVAHIYAY